MFSHFLYVAREDYALFWRVAKKIDPRASSGKFLRVKSRYLECCRFLCLWMTWWHDGMMTWWHGDMVTWWHDDMMTWWHDPMTDSESERTWIFTGNNFSVQKMDSKFNKLNKCNQCGYGKHCEGACKNPQCTIHSGLLWRKVKQMQSMYVCILLYKCFEDTFEKTKWRKTI